MVNKDRIVPITKIDLISMIGTAMKLAGTSFTLAQAKDPEGNFDVTGSGSVGNLLANQPLKSLDFKSGVTAGVVYFIPDYDFEGFKIAGVPETPQAGGATVEPDSCNLYTATLSSGDITIAAITPIVS